ncbi:DUF4286 family protein [Zeimonas arvi]|uniref:DUF4286 family protein n=1 Tax=Zeimonas arvi TaxID=2498847 RepID=UPI00165049A6|nr:DUF4286 family protein [Zeimonas arvi]
MTQPRAQLCIWTDVDPAWELDFNRWYDREHMQERVAIPGFQSARRFQALGECPRPWLALYYTDTLDVFRSEPYRKAFANQTEWSLRNFERMRGTQRRVGELALELGEPGGEGGALAAFVIPESGADMATLREALSRAVREDHVVRGSVLRTDSGLSSPVTPNTPPAPADMMVTIEATQPEAALEHAQALAGALGVAPEGVYAFRMLWRLGA